MGAIRRRNHHEVDLARPFPQLRRRGDDGNAGIIAQRLRATSRVTRDHDAECQPRRRRDERRVEVRAAGAEPDERNADYRTTPLLITCWNHR